MQVLPTVCAILYYLHQLTILYFKETENVSEAKVLTNAVIWPWRVVEIMVMYVFEMNKRDDEEDD